MRLSPRSSFKAVAFAALLLYSLVATAKPSITDLSRVDRVVVEKSTGQATLFLVIDLPLEDGLTKRRVIRKLNLYAAVVKSGQLRERFPEIDASRPVRVLIYHPPKANALGASVLEQIEGHCRQLKFEPIFQEQSIATTISSHR
ncbi:hypothetical protein PMI15_02812 [Polaromonas sp. CF318]|uniref:hypothetical protein n=1 Tax=Polaromonas sp. CF318 TaxID=1144318 RepID=UPI0002712E02|nr:hypothetical protein [Polaromonas sp. CF318]EJL83091.1 hypothetical protein PMI15_02812 [Polaromonas sp. CF318]